MKYRLTIGFVLAVTLSACMPPSTDSQTPRPIKPEDGPQGSVSVDVLGGSFTRRIQASFRLDQAGYVLVGHLGGDGRISVLYPQTPWASGWVSSRKTIRLRPHSAVYDAAPQIFSFAMAPYRGLGAQMDSYDGLGHGYVFLITSRYPIDYGAIMDANGFEDLAIEDYEYSRDPRYGVRSFADGLTTGPYSLRFARNHLGSVYYALATGCPSHWDLGYSYFTYPGASLLNGISFARLYGLQSCRGSQYAYGQRFFPTIVTTVTVPVPGTPPGPLTPRLQRPTRRTLEDPERTRIVSGTSAIERRGPSRGAFDAGERRSRRPTSDHPDFPTRARVREGTRSTSTEVYRPTERASRPMDTPRLTTPSAPPQTTTGSASSGGETRTERPRPQP